MSWVDQCPPLRLVVMQSNIVPTQCKVCLIKSEDTNAPILLPRTSPSPIISIFIYFLPRTSIPADNHSLCLLPGEAKFTHLYYFHISESLQVVVWHISNIFILFGCMCVHFYAQLLSLTLFYTFFTPMCCHICQYTLNVTVCGNFLNFKHNSNTIQQIISVGHLIKYLA